MLAPARLNPDTKKQLAPVAGTSALVLAALVAGVYLADKALAPARPRTITLEWDKNEPLAITEVWASTNLVNWTLRSNVPPGITRVTMPADKPQEFFKVRYDLYGVKSDWARKP